NRLHKALEDAGVKLATVASDILGVSGRAMLEALAQGTTDPGVLADLARGRLRGKLPALRAALAGRVRTQIREDPQRQPLAAHGPHRSGGGRQSREEQRAAGPVSTGPPPSRSEESGRGLGPCAVTDRLPRLGAGNDLSRARRRIL